LSFWQNDFERVNNTILDEEKTMRRTDHDETAQVQADGMRINYNFIKPHMGLEGRTPAEAAGIQVKGENRWLTIIQNAAKAKSCDTER